MLNSAHLTTGSIILLAACGAFLIWLAASWITASYAERLGFPFWPILICAICLSWPLVLLAVTVAGGRREPKVTRTRARAERTEFTPARHGGF